MIHFFSQSSNYVDCYPSTHKEIHSTKYLAAMAGGQILFLPVRNILFIYNSVWSIRKISYHPSRDLIL